MKLLLNRRYRAPEYTIGNLYVGDVKVCETLEDTDRGLTADMPEAEIIRRKIYGKTAIPAGTYHIDMNTVSYKFRSRIWAKEYDGKLPRLQSVNGFSGVLIHVGNDASETEGCILTGWNKKKGKVIQSTLAFAMLMEQYLIPAKERNEEITITIK